MNRSAVMLFPELREEPRVTGHVHNPRQPAARPVTYPQPVHHATMARRVEGMPVGWSARILVLSRPDGTVEPYGPLLAYMRDYQSRTATWQNEVARALGLFWDYSRASGQRFTASSPGGELRFLQDIFRAFALALLKGTITEGRDPLGLYWPSSTRATAQRLVRRIEDFSKWCNDCAGTPERDPTRPPDDGLSLTDILVWSRLRKVGMLSHLSVEPRLVRRRSVVDLGRKTRGHGLEAVKSFPRDQAERLLWEGHRRPFSKTGVDAYGVHNVRDQMMALLDGWGGLRQSEGLHLWVSDVVENPEKPGHAIVVLHHPTEAMVEYVDPITRRLAEGSRANVLNRIYGLQARNEVKRGRYHVGWKGMDLDSNHRAVVHWLDERAASLFWLLYLTYLRFVRKDIMERRRRLGGRDHPFLLVSAGEDRNAGSTSVVGDPYSVQAYERNHRAAVLRLRLPYGKEHGTTTHGLRHMYGRSLADLRLNPEIIRKAMHHVSPLSQLVYTAPDNARTDARLNEAWERMIGGLPEASEATAPGARALDETALGADTTQALMRLRAAITGGGVVA